jgi:uncharacterized protein YjbI with pentapeptide repeats
VVEGDFLDARVRRAALLLAVLLCAAAIVLLVWRAPPALYPRPASTGNLTVDAQLESARLAAMATTRAAFVAGLAGLAALGGLWVNSRALRVNQRGLEDTRRIAEDNRKAQIEALNLQTAALALESDGRITDRYGKAIEQLAQPGHDALPVRLGAIHALERIARESPKDQPSVVAVLSAFVRIAGVPPDDPEPRALDAHRAAPDAQAAVRTLGSLSHQESSESIDWTGAHLERASLHNLDLSDAYLGWTHMQRSYLKNSVCRQTNFDHADLRCSILVTANLANAVFKEARLQGARMGGANLDGAILAGADLRDADLTGATLLGADLRGADLSTARGLTRGELEKTRTNGYTKLPRFFED